VQDIGIGSAANPMQSARGRWSPARLKGRTPLRAGAGLVWVQVNVDDSATDIAHCLRR